MTEYNLTFTETGVQILIMKFFACTEPTGKAQNLVNGMPLALAFIWRCQSMH